MIKLDSTHGLAGIGSCDLQFEDVAQPVSNRTLARRGYRLEATARGLIRYRDCLHHYRVGRLCGGSRWFLWDPEGRPLDGNGRPNAALFDTAGDAMNAAGKHLRSYRIAEISPVVQTESGDLTAVPEYTRRIGSYRDVA